MIYITSDLHLPTRFEQINSENFKQQNEMTKSDYLLVCGDLCAFWDNSEAELKTRSALSEKPFTTLFIDGNHENFDILNASPVTMWNGGKVHRMDKSIIHLMRGQVYRICGKTLFTMGGGFSGKSYKRREHQNWWKDEMPSREEMIEAMDNLEKANWKVDYVLTHSAPLSMIRKGNLNYEETLINVFLQYIEDRVEFSHWYFGHFHQDLCIDEKHTILYNNIIRLL